MGEEETEDGMMLHRSVYYRNIIHTHMSETMRVKITKPAEATLLTPSLAEALLVAAVDVPEVREALWLVADVADAAVAVDEDVETDSSEAFAAEEADAVPVAPTAVVEATSPSGREALGWRFSSAPQLLAISQPLLYSSSHQDDWPTR